MSFSGKSHSQIYRSFDIIEYFLASFSSVVRDRYVLLSSFNIMF